MDEKTIAPVAYIYTDYKEKFGIPRQSGIAPHLMSTIIPMEPYHQEEAFKGIEGYDYLWLIFGFSANDPTVKPSLTVRPPKIGGNTRVGVFASRSPYRPNGLGLSVVKLEKINKNNGKVELVVSGADLLDGTPVYDIKPYIPYADSHSEARAGFSVAPFAVQKQVLFTCEFPKEMSEEQKEALTESIRQDPRPGYHEDEDRIYGMHFGKWNVKFKGSNETITVTAFDIACF